MYTFLQLFAFFVFSYLGRTKALENRPKSAICKIKKRVCIVATNGEANKKIYCSFAAKKGSRREILHLPKALDKFACHTVQ